MLSAATVALDLLRRERTDDFARQAHHERSGGDYGAFSDDGADGYQTVAANLGTVHNDGVHADYHVVANPCAVDRRGVSDGHPVAQDTGETGIGVQHAVVLDVRPAANADGLGVATNHGVEPDARLLADAYISNDLDASRDEYVGRNEFGSKGGSLAARISHGRAEKQ
jgi:hypothetical protein